MPSSTTTETLRAFLIAEKPSAILIGNSDVNPTRQCWLPRSLIDRLTKSPKRGPLTHTPIEFTLPEWKIEQDGLWEFVAG